MSLWDDGHYEIEWIEKDGSVKKFKNYASETGKSLGKLGTITSKIDAKEASLNTSKITFEVFNEDDAFSKFLYSKLNTEGKMLFREIVKLYKISSAGEKEILFKGFISEISLSNKLETKYAITAENIVGKLKTSLWDREFAEYLNETVEDINKNRLAENFIMKEEQEEGKEEKKRVIEFRGHILDCFLGMVKMVLSKPNIAVNSLFLDSTYLDFIDIENLEKTKEEYSSNFYAAIFFRFEEPVSNLFDFFQKQIFQPLGIAAIVNNEGKSEFMLNEQPTVTEGIKTFSNKNIISIDTKEIDQSRVVNHLKFDYKYVNQEYQNSLLRIQANSFKFFGNELIPEKPQTIEIQGINELSRSDQISFLNNTADRIFARFSREINTVTITVPISFAWDVKVGEFLEFENAKLCNWKTGERGLLSDDGSGVDEKVKFEVDDWGGFIEGNTLGTAVDGNVVVTTDISKIKLDVFRGEKLEEIKSFLDNHRFIDEWLEIQGVIA